MLDFVRSLIPDPMRRALILKAARWLSAMVAGALLPVLIKEGFNVTDATSVATAAGGLALAAVSAIGSWLDAKSVSGQIATAQDSGAHQAITTAASSPQAMAALSAAAPGGPQALAAALAKLQTGQA